jgi:hypothetical protein
MKMTKSELKEMIREVLKEELSKRNQLKESVEVLDVAASEVDDLARDVYIDDEFEKAYEADGHTVGEAVEALIVDVVASEYPNIELGYVPDRVRDALENMLDSGLLG